VKGYFENVTFLVSLRMLQR